MITKLAFWFWTTVAAKPFLVFLFFQKQPALGTLASGLLSALFALLVGIAALAKMPWKNRQVNRPFSTKMIIAFVLWAGATLFWTEARSMTSALGYWSVMALDCFIAYLLIRLGPLEEVLLASLRGLVMGSVAFAFVSLVSPTHTYDHRLGDIRLLHPNSIGSQMGIAALCAVYLGLHGAARNISKPIWFGAAALLFVTLVQTLSKTAIAAFCIAVLLFVIRRGTGTVGRVAVIGVIGAVAAFSYRDISEHVQDYLEKEAGTTASSLSGRTALWDMTTKMIGRSPILGYGVLSFRDHLPAVHAHNEWLTLWFSYGLVGVVLAGMLYLSYYWHARHAYKLPASRLLATLAMSLLAFALLRGMTEASVVSLVLPLPLMLILIGGLTRVENVQVRSTVRAQTRTAPLVLKTLFLCAVACLLAIPDSEANGARTPGWREVIPARTGTIPEQYFGLNVINLEYGAAWPTVPFSGWRTGHSLWNHVKKAPGWDFSRLDKDLELARRHNVYPLLILGRSISPGGHSVANIDKDEWRRYVRAIASRLAGRVGAYELWNEPDVKRFFSGTIEDLIELNRIAYTELKAIDPKVTVVSSAMSMGRGGPLKYFERFLAAGGGEYADVIGYHFYVAPRPPEAMLEEIRVVRATMEKHRVLKPLWNTEIGWNILNNDHNPPHETWAGSPLPPDRASAYLARTYIVSWSAGIDRVYWYAWGHRSMGMTDHDGRTPKPIAGTFAALQRWLTGTQALGCEASPEFQHWACAIRRPTGDLARIVWHPNEVRELEIPPEWHVRTRESLDGTAMPLSGSRLSVGPVPVLLN